MVLNPPDTIFVLKMRGIVHFELNVNNIIRVCDKCVMHLMHLRQICELTYMSHALCDNCVNLLMCLMHFVSCRQKLLLFCIWSLLVFWQVSRRLPSLCYSCIRPSTIALNLLFVRTLNKQTCFVNVSVGVKKCGEAYCHFLSDLCHIIFILLVVHKLVF